MPDLQTHEPHGGAAPPEPWGYWATFGFALLALVGSQFAGLALLLWWRPSVLSGSGTLAYDGTLVALVSIVSAPIAVAVLAFAAQIKGWRPSGYFALAGMSRRALVFGILTVVALMLILEGVTFALGRDSVPRFAIEAYTSARAAGTLPLLWFAIVICAPVSEEIAVRGFVFRGWARSSATVPAAIVVSSLLWAVMHLQYDWYDIGQVFCIGLLLGWLRWRSGSTTLTLILHAFINLVAMVQTAVKVG